MFENLKQSWQRFRRSKPGYRFQQRYYEKQQSRRSTVQKILVIAVGVLIFAAGIFFLAAPGPGMIVLLIGASLIAEQSLVAARALDGAELRLRSLYAKSLRLWRRASPAIRLWIVICALAIVAALAFGAYKIAFAAETGPRSRASPLCASPHLFLTFFIRECGPRFLRTIP
jgi:hypothetical protein